MRQLLYLIFVAATVIPAGAQAALPPPDRLAELRCDDLPAPPAVDNPHPRFTWLYAAGSSQAMRAGATRVVIARDAGALRSHSGLVWQSAWAMTPGLSVIYEGPALAADTSYVWTVEVRTAGGRITALHAPATFHTAAGPWSARWIQAPWSTERDGAALDGSHPMPIFRREFTVRARPVEATLRIAGPGQYQALMNGDASFDPGFNQAWTDYRKSITYDTYGVLEQLKPGRNVISVLLGNGMYNVQRTPGRYTKFEGSFGVPKLIAELRIRYADGSSERIDTDAGWQVARGPILFSSLYGGEDFDARRWPGNWNHPGAAGSEWQPASLTQTPGGRLIAAIAPPVRAHGSYPSVSQRSLSPTRTVYDMGQNMAGWPTLAVHGPAGAVLRIRGGELLNPDGTVSQVSTGHPQWWTYILRGGGEERWTPRFSYWGFRYVQTDWVRPGAAEDGPGQEDGAGAADPVVAGTVDAVSSVALSSDSPVTGSFSSSSELLNRIHALVVWAMHNNEVSLFTDCPHRERLGWLEETHLVAPGLLFNNDLQGLYAATAHNISDAQDAHGMVPTIAPQYTKFGPKYPIYDDSPEWGSAAILAPWTDYRFSGDRGLLQSNYPVMQRYVEYLQSRAQDGIVAYGLGDWYDIGPGGPGFEKNTSLGVTGTLMLYEDAVTMSRIAGVLGRPADEARYDALAAREKDAFNRRFWNPATNVYDTGSQTANAMPLALGVVPPERREAVLAHVLSDIHAHQDHITTGEVGFPYLVRALLETGHSDVLLAMALRTDPPSYGSQLAAGATSLTEAWDANPRNSQDHFMLGGIEEWLYRGLGGIDIDLSRREPSERITLRPQLVPGLAWVHAGYNSQLGRVEVAWEQRVGVKDISATVPPGEEATLYVPVTSGAIVQEGGRTAGTHPGVVLLRRDAENAIFRLSSGTFHFHVSQPGS